MNTTKQTLKTYWLHAWKYPKYVIALLITLPIAMISLRLLPPLVVAGVLDRLSRHDYIKGDLWGSFGDEILLYAFVMFTGGVVVWRIVIYLIWKMQLCVERDLYRRMFRKFMDLGADFHANNFGGSLASQTNKLVGSYVRIQDVFAFQIYLLIVSFSFITIILYPKAPVFVWVLIAFSIIFISLGVTLSRKVRTLATIEAKATNKANGYLSDAITNILAVKSFASGKAEQTRFDHATENTRLKGLDVMWATTIRDIASSSITTMVSIVALLVATISVVTYGADIALVFLLFAYAADITERLWELNSTALRNFNRAIGDAQEAIVTLNTQPSVVDPINPEKSRIKEGAIQFNRVNFDHENDNNTNEDSLFHDLNLTIMPGQKIGLVGHSGGGKTTITKLLLRFMDIDSGKILIDGQDISKITQDDLRSSVAYVPQEPLLFHRTLAENINYGNNRAVSKEEIVQAAKHAHAHEFIEKLPKGYDTLVGERGVKLSGGQRQRVAIARAMLKDAPILLLDEATSALDSDSEASIQDALWKLMEGKTTIVIAHRLSTIQKMDRILVLENGEIIEEGSHKELLKNDGIYSELWKHQSGGFIEG